MKLKIDDEIEFEGAENWLCRQDADWILTYSEDFHTKKQLEKISGSNPTQYGSVSNGSGKRKACWQVRMPYKRRKTAIRILTRNGKTKLNRKGGE